MKYCAKCGAELSDTAKFCTSCGQAVDAPVEAAPAVEATPAAPKNKKEQIKTIVTKTLAFLKKHLKIVIALVVVIALVIGGIAIYDSNHCDYSGCDNANAEDAEYCEYHKCNLCKNAKKPGSNYCYYHYYLYGGSSSSSGSSYSSASYDLKFSNIRIQHNSLYTVVTGTVTNNGTRSYKFVTVKGSFKNSAGTVIDTDSTYAVGSEGLSAGESTTFRMSVDKNYNIRDCSISIISYK